MGNHFSDGKYVEMHGMHWVVGHHKKMHVFYKTWKVIRGFYGIILATFFRAYGLAITIAPTQKYRAVVCISGLYERTHV